MSQSVGMEQILKILSRYVVVEELDHTAFIYSYLDSIATLEFILACEQEFEIELANDLLGGEPLSLEALFQEVARRRRAERNRAGPILSRLYMRKRQ